MYPFFYPFVQRPYFSTEALFHQWTLAVKRIKMWHGRSLGATAPDDMTQILQ